MKRRSVLHSAALLIALLSACGKQSAHPPEAAPSSVQNPRTEAELTTITLTEAASRCLGIEIVVVTRSALERTRAFAGFVLPLPGATAQVAAPFDGIVDAPQGGLPMPGQQVLRAAVILGLRGIATQTPGISPIEDRRVRELDLENARRRLARTTELLEIQGASPEERETALLDVARAEAQLASVSAQLQGVAGAADGIPILAPLSGVLGDFSVGIGQTVSAGTPTPAAGSWSIT